MVTTITITIIIVNTIIIMWFITTIIVVGLRERVGNGARAGCAKMCAVGRGVVRLGECCRGLMPRIRYVKLKLDAAVGARLPRRGWFDSSQVNLCS